MVKFVFKIKDEESVKKCVVRKVTVTFIVEPMMLLDDLVTRAF